MTALNQSFVIAQMDYGFDNMTADGIIGFGMNMSGDFPLLLETLKAEGKISGLIFSLYLNDNEYNNDIHPTPESALIIGGVDMQYAKSETTEVVILEVENTRGLWETGLSSVKINPNKVTITSTTVVFDSGSGYISAPKADANALRKMMYEKYPCNKDNEGTIICDCEDLTDYPAMEFTLNDGKTSKVFILPPSAYLLKDDDKCILLVKTDEVLKDSWRLGGPFLRRYYTAFDMESKNILFYPAKVSKDTSHDFDSSVKWIIVFFVVLLIIICIVMSVFLYLFCCRHRMNFDETYKPLFTAKYTLPPHYHRTAVRNANSGEVVPDVMPTSRQNRVFPGISPK